MKLYPCSFVKYDAHMMDILVLGDLTIDNTGRINVALRTPLVLSIKYQDRFRRGQLKSVCSFCAGPAFYKEGLYHTDIPIGTERGQQKRVYQTLFLTMFSVQY